MTEDYSTPPQQSTQTLDPYNKPYADEEYVRLTVAMYVKEIGKLAAHENLTYEQRVFLGGKRGELAALRGIALELFKQGMTDAMGEPTEGAHGAGWYGDNKRCATVWHWAHRVELMGRDGFFEAHECGEVTSAQVLAWLRGGDLDAKEVAQ